MQRDKIALMIDARIPLPEDHIGGPHERYPVRTSNQLAPLCYLGLSPEHVMTYAREAAMTLAPIHTPYGGATNSILKSLPLGSHMHTNAPSQTPIARISQPMKKYSIALYLARE